MYGCKSAGQKSKIMRADLKNQKGHAPPSCLSDANLHPALCSFRSSMALAPADLLRRSPAKADAPKPAFPFSCGSAFSWFRIRVFSAYYRILTLITGLPGFQGRQIKPKNPKNWFGVFFNWNSLPPNSFQPK